jgi:small GTP-binding protein
MDTISKKVCLLGDFAVGKTSLVRRFIYSIFDDRYLSTIGVKVSRKVLATPRGEDVVELTMMLWDLAGAEEFDGVRASYLRGSSGALLVCDLTRRATLDTLRAYEKDLHSVAPGVPIVVAANKSDLRDQYQISEEQVNFAAGEIHAPYYLTSAKSGGGVEEAFRHLGRLVI